MDKQEQTKWAIETAIDLLRAQGNDAIADGLSSVQKGIQHLTGERTAKPMDKPLDKDEIQEKSHETVVYLNEEQLDAIVKEFVKSPVSEEDRRLKMMVLSLVSDLRNARGEIERITEERDDFKQIADGYATDIRQAHKKWLELQESITQLEAERVKLQEANKILMRGNESIKESLERWEYRAIQAEQERNHLLELLKVMKIHIKVGNFEFALMDIDEALSQYTIQENTP